MVRAAPLLLLIAAGCASAPPAPPPHGEVLAASERQYGGLDRMPTPELRRYCISAYWDKRGDKLADCLSEIAARRQWLGVATARDCAETSHACDLLGRELHLRALSALDAGDYADAIRRAGELHSMHRERAGFRYEAIDALGVLAVAHALAEDQSKAMQSLKDLERFGFGPFSGLHYERIWLARAYMAMRDYGKAYAEVRRLDFGFDALTERTAAAYAPTGEADGYRFILHKSELETGRLEAARAGFSQLLASPALTLDPSKTGCVVARRDLERDLARLQAR